jgi:uracil-DNA glycosylase family 4
MRTLEEIADAIRNHRPCGFEPCETCTNFVPGEGPAPADVMVVGEAPGRNEDEQGRPFVGRAGRLLDELLEAAGLDRSAVFVTNVLKARPPGNRDPKADEVRHSMPWLEAQFALVRPKLIVPLGRHALAHFAPGERIAEVHGTLVTVGERRLFPLYHPAAALRSTAMREVAFEDARALHAQLVQ